MARVENKATELSKLSTGDRQQILHFDKDSVHKNLPLIETKFTEVNLGDQTRLNKRSMRVITSDGKR